jgi:hypothetical protein
VPGFSPLDRALVLGDGALTPFLAEAVVRLGTALPFRQAAETLAFFTGTSVSASSVRRRTQSAGAELAAWEREEVDRLEREAPEAAAPEGALLQVSTDGAMVPVVGGEWAEAKVLAIGVVRGSAGADAEVVTSRLSYFARSCEAESFTREALVETQRRGVEGAERVVAVADGAVWIQKLIDHHRPDAVRILDFAHAAESIAQAGKAAYGEGTPQAEAWFERQRHRLRHEEPGAVLGALARARRKAAGRGAEQAEVVEATLGYLRSRREQIRYAEFVEAGYPIGSGAVESANKLVVERRLKGAGMHWARRNLNPMLALRCASANGRWAEAWQCASSHARAARTRQLQQRHAKRRAEAGAPLAPRAPVVPAPRPEPHEPTCPTSITPSLPSEPPPPHPWRQTPFSRRERLRQADQLRRAKS